MKPPNKKGRGLNAAEVELTSAPFLQRFREFRKEVLSTDDPAVIQFNSALARFFGQLRQELRGER